MSKCASDADCVSQPCDTATGTCGGMSDGGALPIADSGTKLPEQPVVIGEFTRCSKNSDCSTNHCVEGVCCDTECTERCRSCALITSPGKCTLAPIGVDLRNDCGPALKCLGTCNGNGGCIGAGAGTMCARNRCTSQSEGIGAATARPPGANATPRRPPSSSALPTSASRRSGRAAPAAPPRSSGAGRRGSDPLPRLCTCARAYYVHGTAPEPTGRSQPCVVQPSFFP